MVYKHVLDPKLTAGLKPSTDKIALNKLYGRFGSVQNNQECNSVAFEPKVKKLLTVPLLKLAVGEPRYIKVTSAMFVGKEIVSKRANAVASNREPATLVNAINLDGGEQCQVICSAVVKGVFEDNYPQDGYVGKCFSLLKLERAAGKEYNGFKVVEIEDPAPPTEAVKGFGGHKR